MNGAGERLILGSRGSALARVQADMVATALRNGAANCAIEIQLIKTSGDNQDQSSNAPRESRFGRKGIFTAEIERALLAGAVDVAVHSAKDLPSETANGVEVVAVLKRAPVEDVFVSKTKGGIDSCQPGAVVATGSVRRENQLRSQHPSLQVVPLRGNVPTRLRRLLEHEWNGIILAQAGLERLGFEPATGSIVFEGAQLFLERLSPEKFVPAGGQGIIALQIRSDDKSTRKLVASVSHQDTFMCLRAEREFLRLLQADCNSPVGVWADTVDGEMTLRVQVFESGRSRIERLRTSIRDQQPEQIALALFQLMYGQGK